MKYVNGYLLKIFFLVWLPCHFIEVWLPCGYKRLPILNPYRKSVATRVIKKKILASNHSIHFFYRDLILVATRSHTVATLQSTPPTMVATR